MTLIGWIQILLYFIFLMILVKPVGSYMARVLEGKKTFLYGILHSLENGIYHLCGIDPAEEMNWKIYTWSLLSFNLAGIIFLYFVLRIQAFLPFLPDSSAEISPDLALNTAVSFVTNTNWQNYAGEVSLSFVTQMIGMTVQNFLSAASGIAIMVALIRGLVKHTAKTIGNFWVDITRSVLYILLPLSCVLAIFLVSQGAVQTLMPSVDVAVVQPYVDAQGDLIETQTLVMGPVASQLAIKHLGTNGGGFMNANSAHPFENPTPVSNFLLILAETVIPASLAYAFGKMVGDTRQGWAILSAMLILLFLFVGAVYAAEENGNPCLSGFSINQTATDIQPGGNMEGKEMRFGVASSALFASVTTATSTGAVNSMHDSFTPLAGLVLMVLMQLGEVVLGGVGSGMYGMLVFVIVAVFIAGLMVGRTPEYLGKKIEPFEIKMSALVILIMPLTVLGLTALAVSTTAGRASISNPGAHGLSQVLYAFTSMGNNNGSAFAGLSGNTLFYNLTGALAMLISRFWLAIPTLALAGSLVEKKKVPSGSGTLATDTPLFVFWLIAVILIVGALNFLPVLALGPIVEHLSMIGTCL